MNFFSVAVANFSGDVNFAANVDVEVRRRNIDGSSGDLAAIYRDSSGVDIITQTGATTDSSGVIEFWSNETELNVIEKSSGRTVSASGGSLSVRIKSGCVLDEAPDDGNTYLRSNGQWVKYP